MASTKRPRTDDIDDIWQKHESLIRRLYEVERKTLKQVKHCMETEHGFPDTPLSTYESKLRDTLQLRKKLKKNDWPIVYRHFRDRDGKETGIYLNGSRIPWNKAWKEIRRSGGHLSNENYDSQLPPGVVLRTPSPKLTFMSPGRGNPSRVPLPLSPTPKLLELAMLTSIDLETSANKDCRLLALDHNKISPANLHYRQSPATSSNRLDGTAVFTLSDTPLLEPSLSWVQSILEILPWNVWKSKIRSTMGENLSIQPGQVIGVKNGFLDNARTNHNNYDFPPNPSNAWLGSYPSILLGPNHYQEPSSDVPAFHFDTYHFLIRAVYLLSNNFIPGNGGSSKEARELLDIIFSRLSRRTLLAFLDIDLSSIRAASKAFLLISKLNDQKDAFLLLMESALKKRDWVLPEGHLFLSLAASLGCLKVVQELINIGARPDEPLEHSYCPAIIEAAKAGSLDCAELLIQNCNVNRKMYHGFDWLTTHSSFTSFIYVSLFELELPSEVLEMMLDAGADVDSILEDHTSDISLLHDQNEIPETWRLTILDQCLHGNLDLFNRLAPYSLRVSTEITRAGTCLAAKRGKIELGRYLDSFPRENLWDRRSFLELILGEQFLTPKFDIDTGIVLSLVGVGTDICLPSLELDVSNLMYRVVVQARLYGFNQEIGAIMDLLLEHGAVLDDLALEGAIAEKGFGMLPVLVDFQADFKRYGGLALATSAQFNNWEAVSWLLEAGVDFNACVPFSDDVLTVMAVASGCLDSSRGEKRDRDWLREKRPASWASIEMIQYLMRCGAKLRYKKDDTDPFTFLRETISSMFGDKLQLDRTRMFLDSGIDLRDPAGSHAFLLEACFCTEHLLKYPGQELATFELLFRRGAPVRPGCALALLISHGGRHELIEEVLEAGADIHCYSRYSGPRNSIRLTPLQAAATLGDHRLVSMLLQKGAEINQPAVGTYGVTAFQAACNRDAMSIEEVCRRKSLIGYLIEQGADVNAPASKLLGYPPLQTAARQGDIELALLLLDRGADPNAFAGIHGDGTALDQAARLGRLDMVQLLLTVGALSYRRGRTGYAEAITNAKFWGRTAVIDLIRGHVRNAREMPEAFPWLMNQEGKPEDWADDFDSI